jgi:hypothetical protein
MPCDGIVLTRRCLERVDCELAIKISGLFLYHFFVFTSDTIIFLAYICYRLLNFIIWSVIASGKSTRI